MITPQQVNKIIEQTLEGTEQTPDLLIAATEGVIMGAAYQRGIKLDQNVINAIAVQSLNNGANRNLKDQNNE